MTTLGSATGSRVTAEGARLVRSGRPFVVRGAIYGRQGFPDPACTLRDLIGIADAGFNTVYTPVPPPRHVLELARELRLQLLVRAERARQVDDALALCAGHASVLAISTTPRLTRQVRRHGRGVLAASPRPAPTADLICAESREARGFARSGLPVIALGRGFPGAAGTVV
jgi:hypothetical protein